MATFAKTLVRSVGGTIGLITIAVVWAAFAFGVVGWPWVRKDVPLLATPEWVSPFGYGSSIRSALVVRREGPDSGVLLFTQGENASVRRLKGSSPVPMPVEQPETFAVYRYDPATKRLSVVPHEAWREAAGPIEECRWSTLLGGTPRDSNVFRWAAKRFTTVGNFIYYGARRSPSRTTAAVLSAEGPKRLELAIVAPFGSRSMYWGQHYHQLFSLEDNAFIGEPVRLPFVTADYSVRVCWSPDEEYVIYADPKGSWLVLVPTTQS